MNLKDQNVLEGLEDEDFFETGLIKNGIGQTLLEN